MNTLSLNGEWTLRYHLEDGLMPETPAELGSLSWPQISAQVPGNVELDLVRAGLEEDPFYAENIYAFRKYEFYQWWFERAFDAPEDTGSRWILRFDGLNTFADIFLNGERVGSCGNMLVEHEFDVTDALNYGEENTLTVRIRSAVNEARKMDVPVSVTGNDGEDGYALVRMPPSSFGWDIMPRFLSAGMWRGVSLIERSETRLTQTYYVTRAIHGDGSADLLCRFRYETDAVTLDDFAVRLTGSCGDSVFEAEKPALFVSGALGVRIPDARLWWPRSYGEQNLYSVKLELLREGQVVDCLEETIGLRTIVVDQVMKPGDEGEFKVIVNDTPVMLMGSNWVPMDAMHSRDAERVPAALALFQDAGCNVVRCWGGNVYEDHEFFDLCDRYGILVWQDFAMACCTYPDVPGLIDALEKEATKVVRKLRNHPSILLWAGDNECDEMFVGQKTACATSRYNPLTREVLPRVVRLNDPSRMFLPSSPYIPEGIKRYLVPEQHNWGARAYFKDDFYKHTTAHFISECGYHGCPSVASLKKFIPEDMLTPWLGSSVWDTHNTDYLPHGPRHYNRIGLMDDQVRILFGSVPQDLEQFSLLSQISQAEAKKFFIERTRVKKWLRTGVIWWNMIDGWPQISDAVVDYYYDRKLAYYYIKRAQQDVCLILDEQVDWGHDVYLCNDGCWSGRVEYSITDGESGETLLCGACDSAANQTVRVGNLRVLPGEQKLLLLKWTRDGKTFGNHYITGFPPYNPGRMILWQEIIARTLGND